DISNSGYATLLANSVSNEGTIKAIKGSVRLIGANEVSINLNGNSIVDLTVDKGVLDSLVENKGAVYADGGEIFLTTNAVDELLKGVVNNTGIIEANSLDGVTGYVELFAHGGEAKISGTIEAKDGFVETSADKVKISDEFKVKANKWLIDPKDFTIASSGGDITGTTLSSNLENASVEIQSVNGASDGNGDIFVNDTVSWDANTKLTLNAQNDIFINKSITATNGQLALHYGDSADYYINAQVNLSAGNNFFTKQTSDGSETVWTVITDLGNEGSTTGTDLQGINGNLSGNYVLGADIDAGATSSWNSSAGWEPIGVDFTNSFSGNFDGLGHTISNMTIDRPTENNIGLFGRSSSGSSVSNLKITNIDFTGQQYVGGIVGFSYSELFNVTASGQINFTKYAGGLVGTNYRPIENSYANINLNSTTNFSYAGGLVGYNYSDITNSYATGLVNAVNYMGGLVGNNSGTVTNSWYDNEVNTDTSMSDKDTYGKTKAEIVTALSSLDAWTAGGGASVEGYSTATPLALPQLITFYTSNGEILFAGGFGTEADPYEITNWTQLQNINNGNILTQNYYFSLLNDLGSTTNDYANLASNTANGGAGWNPIGDSGNAFTGNLNGLGHKVNDLTINRGNEDYIGLFGELNGGSIQNLGVTRALIVGNERVGGLVGTSSSSSSITNSYVTGSVSGVRQVGGLIGNNNSSTVENSYSTATVNGTGDYLGGLIGYNAGAISNSYTTGDVSADEDSSTYVGGLVGYQNGSTITNSYATNKVTIPTMSGNTGGLVGRNSQGTITNSYYDEDMNSYFMLSDSDLGKTTAELRDLAAKNWDDTVWVFGDATIAGYGLYNRPYLKNLLEYPDMTQVVTGTLFNGGFGTSANPYGITNWTQLQNINNSNILTQDYYFKLLNDLDSSTSDYTTQASASANSNKGWNPIGLATNFKGVFDGMNHTIDSLTMNNTFTNANYVGLFGTIWGESVIKNIHLTNLDITTGNYVGGLVGYVNSEDAIIENASVSGKIVENGTSNQTAAGLVGINKGTILNSHSKVDLTGTYYVGGLVGWNRGLGLIKNSYSDSIVNGGDDSTSGGLVGWNYQGTIENSYALGKVMGTSLYLGGLVGANSDTIKNSYFDGIIEVNNESSTTNANIGAVTGLNGGTIENSYASGKIDAIIDANGNDVNIAGVAGKNSGTIKNSYSNVEIKATVSHAQDVNIAGVAGDNSDTIENSYASGKIAVNDNSNTNLKVGGVAGINDDVINNSYYDKTLNENMSDEELYGKTTAQLQDINTFKNENSDWNIVEDSTLEKGTPILSWQVNKDGENKPIWIIGTKVTTEPEKPTPEPELPEPEKKP
ncbi:hypothetical protein CP960_12710, partial [Malaciobacter halophilus]